jgi:serralysin
MCVLCAMRLPSDPTAALDQHIDAAAPVSRAPWTLDQIAGQLTDGYWNSQGFSSVKFQLDDSRTLTYNVQGLSAAERAIAVAALQAWTEVTGITFVASTSANASLMFDNNDPSGAYADFTTSGSTILQSFVNIPANWAPRNLNSYMLQTYMHEIGHALGLGHAGNYNDSATYGVDNLYDNDSWLATVMSYFDQIDNTAVPGSFAWISTLMPADIIAIQNLYGYSGATNDGNSVYGFGSNIGGYLQTLLNQWTGAIARTANVYVGQPVAFTIYDSNGIDTINFSNFGQNQEIRLIELSYSNVGGLVDNVTIARGVVVENATSGAGRDTLIGNDVGNVLTANGGNDQLFGGFGDDTLYGGAGNDSLYGGEDNDQLYGSTGSDRMEGGNGDDTYYVNVATDLVVEVDGGGLDVVSTALTNHTLAANVENLLLKSTLNSVGTGNAISNVITGGVGSDTLFGLDGEDILNGGAGNDRLEGGNGHDIHYGGDGNDSAFGGSGQDYFFGELGNDRLYGGLDGDELYGGDGNDSVYGEDGNDFVVGDAGNDLVSGGAGNDVLSAGDGADRVNGGAGDDIYYGGSGADQFIFATMDGRDTLGDFASGIDKIGLSRSGLGISATATIASLWQTGSALPETFAGASPVLYYDSSTLTLYLDQDGGSSSNADALFDLQVGGTLAASDFIFFA